MAALSMPPTRTTCSPGRRRLGSGRSRPPGGARRYGMYFDQTQVGLFAQNVQDPGAFPFVDPFRTDVLVWNASLSNPGAGGTGPPFAVLSAQPFATSDRFVAPRWQHWNLGLQRRLYSRGMLDLGYVGGRGDHLLRYININQPPATSQGDAAPNLVRPFPGYDAIFMRETTARSGYHGLVTSFRHDAGRAGSATVNYTFSRNKADATYDNAEIDNPQNVLDKDAEYAAAGTDRAHIFTASYVYELPFARAATGGWRKGLLQGWQIAGITRIESGPAVRIQVAELQFRRLVCRRSSAAGSGRRPRGWRPDGSALVRPRSVRTAAGTRVWQRAGRAVPSARPSPVGHRPVEEREPRWHEAPPVQGRPDQRVQSDAVPGCEYSCVSATTTCDPRVRIRPGHEHAAAARDPAWHQIRLVTRSAVTAIGSRSVVRRDVCSSGLRSLSVQSPPSSPRRQPPSRAPRRYQGLQTLWT